MFINQNGFGTDAITGGHEPEQWDMNQIIPPISLTTTYKQEKPGEPKVYDYIRAGNPTRDVLQKNLAVLEKAKYCRIFSSGLSAIMSLANLLKYGDEIICSDDVYGGTYRYFQKFSVEKHGIKLKIIDFTNLDFFQKVLDEDTKMIWFETPSNPLLKVLDIQKIVEITKKYNPLITIVVDNTFLTPYFQNPLSFGADVVLHSVTKYINGHSDVCMGAVMTNNKEIDNNLVFTQLAIGALPSPFDAYLVLRGIKTLHLRMQAHMDNALEIAKFLESSEFIEKVLYPELPSHPQYMLHKQQTSGMSGIISFYLKGDRKKTEKFISNLKHFTLAESLGGCDSLIEIPSIMTHASLPLQQRLNMGITDNLIRLSVGCENVEDLLKDIKQALNKAME